MPCHSLDQKVIGPPLRGVVSRTSEEWVTNWVRRPMEFIKTNKEAKALYEAYSRTQHTTFNTMTDEQIEGLIAYLQLEESIGQ